MTDITEPVIYVGAVFGALQAIAQVVMLFASKNTIAWKWAKYITSGQQRPPSE